MLCKRRAEASTGHFTGGGPETQKGEMTWLKPQKRSVAEPEAQSSSPHARFSVLPTGTHYLSAALYK